MISIGRSTGSFQTHGLYRWRPDPNEQNERKKKAQEIRESIVQDYPQLPGKAYEQFVEAWDSTGLWREDCQELFLNIIKENDKVGIGLFEMLLDSRIDIAISCIYYVLTWQAAHPDDESHNHLFYNLFSLSPQKILMPDLEETKRDLVRARHMLLEYADRDITGAIELFKNLWKENREKAYSCLLNILCGENKSHVIYPRDVIFDSLLSSIEDCVEIGEISKFVEFAAYEWLGDTTTSHKHNFYLFMVSRINLCLSYNTMVDLYDYVHSKEHPLKQQEKKSGLTFFSQEKEFSNHSPRMLMLHNIVFGFMPEENTMLRMQRR